MDLFVPAYFGPWDVVQWEALFALKPTVVVINPASGPGRVPHTGYRELVDRLRQSGTEVLGYVDTSWLTRPCELISIEVDLYADWYGVNRIFFDQVPSQPKRGRTDELAALVGLSREPDATVCNPGVPIPNRWYHLLPSVRWCTFEGTPELLAKSTFRGPPARQIHLVHGVTQSTRQQAHDLLSSRGVGLACVTKDSMPNPWDVCPESLKTLTRKRLNRA